MDIAFVSERGRHARMDWHAVVVTSQSPGEICLDQRIRIHQLCLEKSGLVRYLHAHRTG